MRPNVELFTLSALGVVPADVSASPVLTKIATQKFQQRYALVGFNLASTIYMAAAFGVAGSGGVFLVVGQSSNRVAISQSLSCLASHPAEIAALAAVDVTFSDSTPVDMDNFDVVIPSGGEISLFAHLSPGAVRTLSAVCALQLVRLP
jgi:hypothetical protein